MGKLVPFAPKQEAAQLESALERAGALFQRRLKAREKLPKVLAALIEAGYEDLALQTVVAWGRGEVDPATLLEECEAAAAVARIDLKD